MMRDLLSGSVSYVTLERVGIPEPLRPKSEYVPPTWLYDPNLHLSVSDRAELMRMTVAWALERRQ
jgi:hypothetical protein